MSDRTQRILFAIATVCFAISAINFGFQAAASEGDTSDLALAVAFVLLIVWAGVSFRRLSPTTQRRSAPE